MKKLDRSKPYGTIHGDTEGRYFEQDGVYFDVDGKEWAAPNAPAAPAAPAEPPADPKKTTKPSATDEEIARQLKV